ncbi:interleukin-32 isoform X2 [Hyaena hyaena]|uniref:interleukin-32 isoform X2 n=1 Tax=Hyaena hyaena TaxID=95912 RepID=UPI00192389A2|nr:interleukin-32 isoform X2 [Hyaena hyaena]
MAARSSVEFMREHMHQLVDECCDNYQHQPQGEKKILEELENGFNEVMLEAVDLHYQNNNQETSPLLLEVQQELRLRICKPSEEEEDPGAQETEEDPGAQETEEGFCDRVLRLFKKLLLQLQEKWQAALAWVKQKVAAGLQAFSEAVEAIWSALKSFCASVARVSLSCIQA